MNKLIKTTILGCFWASLIIFFSQSLVSCIKDNEIQTSPECAITSFTVGSIKSYVTVKKYDADGNATDTLVARTVSGSDIFFNIDQVRGLIATVDSLPNWIDLTHVVPSFMNYGTVYGKIGEDDLYYPIVSGEDSIDFSKPVELLCLATDGMSKKIYTVEMKKASNNVDTLEWKRKDGLATVMRKVEKAVAAKNAVVAFGRDAQGKAVCSSSKDGKVWSDALVVDNEGIDLESVVMFKGACYALGENGTIMRSDDGVAWTVASQQKATRILAADDYYLYITDESAVLGSSDMETWTVQGRADLAMLPTECVSSVCYRSRTNSNLALSVMSGLCPNDGRHAAVWYKVSSPDESVNQMWAYMKPATDNPYALPRLEGMSMAHYDGALYAIGVKGGKYDSIYRSTDNGIAWRAMSSKYPMPEDIDPADGKATLLSVGKQLWIVQENGNVWLGAIM